MEPLVPAFITPSGFLLKFRVAQLLQHSEPAANAVISYFAVNTVLEFRQFRILLLRHGWS